MNIDFNELSRDIWPIGTPTAVDRLPELSDYALGGLDIQVTELQRRTKAAHHASKVIREYAEHPDRFELKDGRLFRSDVEG